MSLIFAIAFGVSSALALCVGLYAYIKGRRGTADETWQGNLAVIEIGLVVIAIGLGLGLLSGGALLVRAL